MAKLLMDNARTAIKLIAIFSLSTCAVWLALPAALAKQVTDDRGQRIVFATPPLRIVSTLPSLTEMVCALGQCTRLVGVDRYSNWPASVHSLPKVGGGLDPSIEAIVALRPDVVLVAKSMRGAQRLQALGLNVVALEPQNHADTRRVLQTLGQLLGLPDGQAQSLWETMEADIRVLAQSLPPAVRQTSVYFEVSAVPYGAGASSYMGQTLSLLGAHNILPAHLGTFPKINPEWVVRANPDVIMVSQDDAKALAQRPGWQRIRAVREGRVCSFNPLQGDTLVRPGPRMAQGAQWMAQCLTRHAKEQK